MCLFQQHDGTSLPFGTEVSIARIVVSASMIAGGVMLLTLWKQRELDRRRLVQLETEVFDHALGV